MLYDDHISNVLIPFYLDSKRMSVYHGRWDTWLITQNLMDEYFYMMMKTDHQVATILNRAHQKARELESSPLAKALKED
jgi:hypothetical protein